MAAKKIAKQTELKGIEKPKHEELDKLMEEHAAHASALGEARQRMGELSEQMLAYAKKHNLKTYRDDTAVPPLLFTLTEESAKVKVKPAKVAPADVEVDEAGAGE